MLVHSMTFACRPQFSQVQFEYEYEREYDVWLSVCVTPVMNWQAACFTGLC